MLSALIASLCCIGPLVLVLFGIGGASTALAIGYRKPYFLLFGLAMLIIGFGFLGTIFWIVFLVDLILHSRYRSELKSYSIESDYFLCYNPVLWDLKENILVGAPEE